MYPLDFEEFLWAMGAGEDAIATIAEQYKRHEPLNTSTLYSLTKRV